MSRNPTGETAVSPSTRRSTRRWPRRPTSRAPSGTAPSVTSTWGRAASRTASARASRSSLEGPSASGSGASRSTSQPRGAESRSECSLAQVVGVRLGEGGERAEDGRLVAVDVGERGDRRPPAGGPGATAGGTHEPDAYNLACRRRG